MSGIIEGYSYDIFISYRQKDNKGDRWVSEFVDSLRTELESTFKEEIRVYFDINPHDGLLETHDVDASLKEKLKCLIFIPIISRTYCDPRSFAWEHEFKAFVEQASRDQFGLKVRLANGNVANRVLPVRIHDLDTDDIKLCESILGGVLRGIEFIYKETGFNRPLKPDDDEKINLNKTKYRNQITKVALAIKEIVSSIGYHEQKPDLDSKEVPRSISENRKNNKKIIVSGSIILIGLIILGCFYFPKLLKTKEKPDKSIAVLPFVNDSPDKENDYFCNGMMDEILTQLQNIHDLKVKSRTSVEKYRSPDKDIKVIGKELGVTFIIEGSVRKIGDDLRITTQLIDTKSGNHLWADTYDGKYTTEIFEFQNNVAKKVASSLNAVITPQEAKRIDLKPTSEILAHDLYLKGSEMITKWHYTDDSLNLKFALNLFYQALEHDPKYIDAISGISLLYTDKGKYDSALFYIEKIENIDPYNSVILGRKAGIYFNTNKPDSAIKYFQKELEINPNLPWSYAAIGQIYYCFKNDLIKGLPYYQKGYDLGGDTRADISSYIAHVYLYIDYYPKALEYYKKALSKISECNLFGEYAGVLVNQEKYDEAIHFMDSISSIAPCEHKSDILKFQIYTTQNEFSKAEKYYVKAVDAGYKRSDDDDIYIGYLYKETGRINEALQILNNSIKRDENFLRSELKPWNIQTLRLRLAAAYAILGENTKALSYLSEVSKLRYNEWPFTVRSFPGFNKLRDNTEFKSVLKRIEDQKDSLRAQVMEMEKRGELHL
jgi:TolB-like protein/Tfp pilus assembly protein PilF